jgi:Helicase HerA, central domain
MPAHHLTTHGCILGMTGSGKTGLVFIAVEEALRNRVPVLMIDVKGDLPNLLLSFPDCEPHHFVAWVEGSKAPGDSRSATDLANAVAEERKSALSSWGIGDAELRAFHDTRNVRLITPGSTSGEGLHVLSALERPSQRWTTDPEAAQAGLAATTSLMLRLVGRDADPARSREHADRERVIEGLATGDRKADQALDQSVQQLAKRWFVLRDMHTDPVPVLLQPRYAMTYMRGPMTRSELMRAVGEAC